MSLFTVFTAQRQLILERILGCLSLQFSRPTPKGETSAQAQGAHLQPLNTESSKRTPER
jgi:hypothetical protein